MIQGIIDKAIAVARAEKNLTRISSGKFNVSDAGKCRLMRYWKRQGKTIVEPDERAFRVFEVGHIIEKWVISMLNTKTAPITFQEQVLVEDEHRKGFADLIFYTPDSQTILYDIKTVHSRKFWRNEKEGWDKADLHYKCQVLTYNSMLPKPCNSLRLLYVSKDDLCMAEVGVTGNESAPEGDTTALNIKEYCDYDWLYLINRWKAKIEPIANPMAWECEYCGYKDTCEFKLVKVAKVKKGKKEAEAI